MTSTEPKVVSTNRAATRERNPAGKARTAASTDAAFGEFHLVFGQDAGREPLPGDLCLGGRLGAGPVPVGDGGHDQKGHRQQQLQQRSPHHGHSRPPSVSLVRPGRRCRPALRGKLRPPAWGGVTRKCGCRWNLLPPAPGTKVPPRRPGLPRRGSRPRKAATGCVSGQDVLRAKLATALLPALYRLSGSGVFFLMFAGG